MIDLHIHTTNSDGTYSAYEIIEMLINLGITQFSITDHDDVSAYKEIKGILLPDNITYIPGIEFSAIHNNYQCHILGYGIDCSNKDLLEQCALIKHTRIKKITQVLEYIRDMFGKIITDEEAKKILNKKGTVGRYDICEVLLKKPENEGLKRSEIYDQYLSPNNLIVHRIPSKIIIDTIHKAGGKAILAHPKEIEEDYPEIDIEKFIYELIKEGLDGIELYNSIHTPEDVERYREMVEDFNKIIRDKFFLTTGGSDFHGTNKPKIQLGRTTTKQKILLPQSIFFPY